MQPDEETLIRQSAKSPPASRPGVGVGAGSWREHSLFVPGIPWWNLDATARRFGQLGVVRGIGREPAQLHVLM